MSQHLAEKIQLMRNLRDAKARPHLSQYAPVWMVAEEIIPDEDSILFSVVFLHPSYGWTNRRYRFDAFNDVLYHMGQHCISENEAYNLEQTNAYIEASAGSPVDAYGG